MTVGVMAMASAYAEDVVIAVVNKENIYASDLEKLMVQYKQRAQKQELTQDEVKQLVDNLAIHKLILQHPDAQALKNDAEIRRKVKAFEDGLIVSQFVTGYVNARVFVTEEDLRNYYKTHQDQFTRRQNPDGQCHIASNPRRGRRYSSQNQPRGGFWQARR